MAEQALLDRRILVVEDEYLVADDLCHALGVAGATVVGPAASVAQALALIREEAIDGALLDVNLNGEKGYPVADMLAGRCVPFVFATGYGAGTLPERFAGVTVCCKPIVVATCLSAVADEITRSRQGGADR